MANGTGHVQQIGSCGHCLSGCIRSDRTYYCTLLCIFTFSLFDHQSLQNAALTQNNIAAPGKHMYTNNHTQVGTAANCTLQAWFITLYNISLYKSLILKLYPNILARSCFAINKYVRHKAYASAAHTALSAMLRHYSFVISNHQSPSWSALGGTYSQYSF